MHEYVIRRASESDLPHLQALNQKLFEKECRDYDQALQVSWPYDTAGEKYFREAIQNNYVAVAECNGEIVGYLAGSFGSRSYRNECYAEVDNMFVEPGFRSCGVGGLLMKDFLQYCKKSGVEVVKVTAYAANEAAIKFYRKNGFADFELTLKRQLV